MCLETSRKVEHEPSTVKVADAKTDAVLQNPSAHDATFELGRASDNYRITGSLRPSHTTQQTLKVGIDGHWYDLTNFRRVHPGGDILWEFNNCDATVQFMAFHDPKVLARVEDKRDGERYKFSRTTPGGSALEGDWIKLNDKLQAQGFYEPNLPFLYTRWAIVAGFFAWMLVHIYLYVHCSVAISSTLASAGLALVWQQSGFLLHDAMHNHHFQNRRLDQAFGQLYSVLFGVSSRWWRDEHFEHHVFTNTYVEGYGCSDPQFFEEVWAQDPALIPFVFQPLLKLILKFQKYYFIPICVFVGSLGIRVDSMLCTRRPVDLVCMGLHFVWVGVLVAQFPTWNEGLWFYYRACCLGGFLSMQLLISHYDKPFTEKQNVKKPGNWTRRQIEAVLDIMCPVWLDWFFGGLHLHAPHHLFPRLNRCHYRQVYPWIEELCHKHNVALEQLNFIPALQQTLQHLGEVGDLDEKRKRVL